MGEVWRDVAGEAAVPSIHVTSHLQLVLSKSCEAIPKVKAALSAFRSRDPTVLRTLKAPGTLLGCSRKPLLFVGSYSKAPYLKKPWGAYQTGGFGS